MENFEELKEKYYEADSLMLESYDSERGDFDEGLFNKVDKLREQLREIIDPEDREQVLFALEEDMEGGLGFEYIIPEKFENDIEVLVKAIDRMDGIEYLDFSFEQKNNIPLMKSLIEKTPRAWFYAGKKVLDNEECLYAYLNNGGNPSEIKRCSDRIKSDPKVALNIIKNIEAKKEKYYPDRIHLLEEYQKNGVFPYLAANIKKMENVILEAAKVYGKSMKWEIDKDLKKNPEFMEKFNEALEEWKTNSKRKQNHIKGYQGIFLDEETQAKLVELQKVGLDTVVKDMHVTLNFGELQKYPQELMEKDIPIELVGYASDGKNSGFEIKIPEEIKSYKSNNNPLHITVSLGEVDGVKGNPVDTGKLKFEKLEEPIQINGRLGYFKFEEDRTKSRIVMDNSIFENERKIKENELKEKIKESDELDTTLEKVEQLENMQDDKKVSNNLDEDDSGEQK